MNPRYSIRPARPADVPRLPDVEREAAELFESLKDELGLRSLGQVNTVEAFREARKAGRLWVACDESDEPVGFALVLEIDGEAHLDELDVLPGHGRRGIGVALLRTVCDWAAASGYAGVTLSTFRDVPWNAPFYARHGFRILDAAELPPGLARLVEGERERGLRTELRVIMRWESGGSG